MDYHPEKKVRGRRFVPAVILLLCLAGMAISADAASTRMLPATTTPSAFQRQQTIEMATPTPQTISCQAPCSCMERERVISAWGTDGFTQCAEQPCGYGYTAAGQPIEKYCYKQKAVATATRVQVFPREISPETVITTQTPVSYVVNIPTTRAVIGTKWEPADNCPDVSDAAGQEDDDNDAIGNPCDNCWLDDALDQTDSDGDCELMKKDPYWYDWIHAWGKDPHCGDPCDNCPAVSNPDQNDSDKDGAGDACDICGNIQNFDQTDTDGDCQLLKNDPQYWDSTGKKWLKDPHCGDACDNCPAASNPDQENSDNDHYGNACDNCWTRDSTGQSDSDGDCTTLMQDSLMWDSTKKIWKADPNCGDVCDTCPQDWNPSQLDINKNGMGDACDCSDHFQGQYEQGVDCGWQAYMGHVGLPQKTGCPQQRCSPCPYEGEALPAAFSWTDWRGVNWLTPVKNQDTCGGCWAFAPVGGMEAWYTIQNELVNDAERPDLSEQWLISGHPGMGGSCAGGKANAALNDIQANGVLPENLYPFTSALCGDKHYCAPDCCGTANSGWGEKAVCANPFVRIFPSNADVNMLWKIDTYNLVDSDNPAEVKKALLCHGPLIVSSVNWKHVVVLVGWDDNAVYDTSAPGCWIYKNSWGTNWPAPVVPSKLYIPSGYGVIPYTGCYNSDIISSGEGYLQTAWDQKGGFSGFGTISVPKYINFVVRGAYG